LIVHQCICYNSLYFQFQLYYAEFEFDSRNENEVSLFEHQVVMVINPHDQNGNPEWWYVEADGVYGYAPSSYLRKMDTHWENWINAKSLQVIFYSSIKTHSKQNVVPH